MTDYKSMFEQAVRTLAAIDEALGIGDDGCGDPEQTLDAIACLKASPISEEAMDILRAENEKLKTEVEEFAVLTSRLARQLKKAAPDNELPGKAADYLKRTGRQGSPLREVGAGETARAETAKNVFAFPATTTMTPEQALRSALEFATNDNLQDVLVVGYDGDGALLVRSSRMDRKEALWLSEQLRKHALSEGA